MIEENNNACFSVRDKNGQALAYVYLEDEPGRRTAADLLTRDQAHRVAANIAKLPDLLAPKDRPLMALSRIEAIFRPHPSLNGRILRCDPPKRS